MTRDKIKPDIMFEIRYEDTHLIVVSKSAGLLSQGDSSGDRSLVDLLRSHFGRHYVGLIHRLDRNTSGLLVVAKRSKAADRLTQSLQSGRLERAYLALIHGELTHSEQWNDFLLKDERTNEVRLVKADTPKAKSAALICDPIATQTKDANRISLVRLQLETGRSHQIRVQAASRNHAIIGDLKYGDPKAKPSARRPLLHSAFLRFEHPMSHEIMVFSDSPPDEFEAVFGQLPEISAINPFK